MDIGCKYKSWKFLGFIATKGAGSTDLGDPYLYHFPDTYYNVSIWTIVCTFVLVGHINFCNKINNHINTHKYDLELDKYWVTQSGYFRLETTVSLGMCITDRNFLFCNGIPYQIRDRKLTMREYKKRTIYECFNNPFLVDLGITALKTPPMLIDDSPCLKKYRYTSDPLPDSIYFPSKTFVSTFTAPCQT